jgi:hypothetical protein
MLANFTLQITKKVNHIYEKKNAPITKINHVRIALAHRAGCEGHSN